MFGRRPKEPETPTEPTTEDLVLERLHQLTVTGQLTWTYMLDWTTIRSTPCFFTMLDGQAIECRSGVIYFARPGKSPIFIDAFDEPLVHVLNDRFANVDHEDHAEAEEYQAMLASVLSVEVVPPTQGD